MVISAIVHPHHHLFLTTPKPLHHRNHHHSLTTVTIPPLPPTPTPHLPFKKPSPVKTHATFLPIQPFNFLSSTSISTPPLSETLALLLAFSKTVVEKLSVSIHEFKMPLVAIANAVGKWVDLYHSVLMVRILLSWFPNMPWEKQPFSAIRDLCDPCLSFFRTIMPPTANKTIDLSPILAFVFFGVLSSFLKTSVQGPN
ncbi:hypothetical protein RND81_06G221300 [Saponaria officinalis]|uniref:YGGT family protein n=1 Tax=Saponaria officinalis TaxID=3572 RepID=A0AAW1KEB9_SAPOF